MDIYTTYFANIRHLPDSILPVSIALKPPERWNGAEYKYLAPGYELLRDWKKNGDEKAYTREYIDSILSKSSTQEIINDLNDISDANGGKDIALVCYESPKDFCHRHIASSWLNTHGCCVKEYVDMSTISDSADGSTHINMYSKGKTELGRMLSNFYKFPIRTEDGEFMSVEGYWYWLLIDKSFTNLDVLRNLHGFSAKNTGKELLESAKAMGLNVTDPNFENKIMKAVWYKFRRNTHLLTPEYRRLPIVHYYSYGGKIVDVTSKHQWLIDGITKMRDYL